MAVIIVLAQILHIVTKVLLAPEPLEQFQAIFPMEQLRQAVEQMEIFIFNIVKKRGGNSNETFSYSKLYYAIRICNPRGVFGFR
jgi:hypothetical protein